MSPLAEVTALFLKLGFTAFGGPAAHIGIMHDEVVVKRKWLSDEEFLDLLGATNLIPGPHSTEMAISRASQKDGRTGEGAWARNPGGNGTAFRSPLNFRSKRSPWWPSFS